MAANRRLLRLRDMETRDPTDAQGEQFRPLLPPPKPHTGRPANDHRTVITGLRWVLQTGSPWRCLPARDGAWKPVARRVSRWPRAGVWERILAARQPQADADGRLDWSLHLVDSTVLRAHQPTAGAIRGIRQPRRWDAAGVATARRSTSGVSGAACRWCSS